MPLPGPERQHDRLRELSYLFGFLRPYRGRFRAAMAASMISMSFGLMFPWLVGHMIDAAFHSSDELQLGSWRPGITDFALLLLGTLVIQAILTFFSSFSF